jgi:predicted membrane channel-forming protein YqfA (hemolysin III family)
VVTPTSTRWRFFRAGVVAVVATWLAALGHVLGGGQLPDLAVLFTVTIFVGGSLSGLATKRRSGGQIFGVLVVSQLLFHVAFQLTAHSHAAESWLPTGQLLLFHLIAATLTSVLLAGGESTLFRLFAALHRAFAPARIRPVVGLAPQWTAVITGGAGGALLEDAVAAAVSRRGPPAVA